MSPENEVDEIEQAMRARDGQDSVAALIESFTSSKGIAGKTSLSDPEKNVVFIFLQFARAYPQLGFEQAAEQYMQLCISRKGKSRQEIVDVLKGLVNRGMQEPDNFIRRQNGF